MQFETLGPYEILREWGRGPAGPLLLARHRESGREVSIQLFDTLDGLAPDERAAAHERVLQSCRALFGTEHPNLIRLLDAGEHQGRLYVVWENVEGTSLDVHCRPDSLLPAARVLDLAAGAARALAAIHRAGGVHGDLRPGSLIRVGDAVRLAGYGCAACTMTSAGHESRYQSPEQVRREPPEPRSDIFSLGAVLYELLTGRHAFAGDTPSTVLYRIVNEEVADPTGLDPPVHAAAAEVVLRALAKSRQHRFQEAEQFARALNEASVALGVDTSLPREAPAPGPSKAAAQPVVPPPPQRAGPRSRLRPFVLGTVLVLLLGVAGASVLLDLGRDPEPVVESWLEARVRTEPPGVLVLYDGEPLSGGEDGRVRFRGSQPFGVLTASYACRTVERPLDPADAGSEVVLVMDPVETDVEVDPSVDGARVLVNGDSAGITPTSVKLDLCRDNKLELKAEGFRTAAVEIPSGATPLEARKLAYSLALEPIPKGRLRLPRKKGLQLVYYVDGKRIGKSVRELELEEGEHVVRFKNDFHWLDVTTKVKIAAGESIAPDVDPRFGTLVVQAFPSNCKVFVRRPGGKWRFLDETPAERRLATGRLEVKVQLIPTGESRVETVRLREGANPPVRVSFGGSR